MKFSIAPESMRVGTVWVELISETDRLIKVRDNLVIEVPICTSLKPLTLVEVEDGSFLTWGSQAE